ncbi:sigma-70 family RNA polymerase sigma factor [Gilvimarinus agarilyticus]|uniref:RNA polymerase sigma factor n=1 Tax=Gilvimarinus sp. 2_MG-2023 TaxID=3062666 RepID=UPI001C0A2940|nr:sigma-70 family RNA polymerase sigma factor [Gilvimarinus sp. 2_MG-2023]MBU2887741.1 sigma-70 family RNA polymerase sigma factor [Gilvimarinus agarilyticus]MDO6572389.1 sigma-70 family RNA polymerase sigma factor [Gilvimarinus sp. 2_MG-2023]
MKLATDHTANDAQRLSRWVARARGGDIKAFEYLVSQQQSLVRSYLAKRTDYRADVDDLAQESFVLAWQKLATLHDDAAFSGWVLSIAQNLLRNHHRKHARLAPTEPDLLAQLLDEQQQQHPDEQEAELSLLRQCLLKLDHPAQKTLRLYYREGYSLQELREAMDVAHSTLTMRLNRYRKKLRDCINRGH